MYKKESLLMQCGSTDEKKFVNAFLQNGEYPFKNDFFRFAIITDINNKVLDKQNIYSFFEGLLNNMICLKINNNYLIIYHNKKRVNFKDMTISLIDDIGDQIVFFDGFSIDIKRIDDLDIIINLYIDFLKATRNGYYYLRDLILYIEQKDAKILKQLKNIILNRFTKDASFEKLIIDLFNNDLNVTKTSKFAYMHRNTINNKLDVLKDMTGLEMQKFKDAVAMYELLK